MQLAIFNVKRIFPPVAILLMLTLGAMADEADAITIVRIEPEVGSAVADTVVEIRGTGFPERPQVFFGDAEAEVLLRDTLGGLDRLLVRAGPSRDGKVDVRIVDPDAPNRFGTSSAIEGEGYEYVGETIIVPIITGTVTIRSSGKALIGAHITTMPGGRAGIADLRGAYSVVLPSPGTYTVRAYASGFRSASQVVIVSQGDAVQTLNLDLEPFTPGPADSDGDGLSDEAEATRYGTDPFNPDTDSDGLGDGNEVKVGLNPLDFSDGDIFRRADTDFSGVVDARDLQFVINACVRGDSPPTPTLTPTAPSPPPTSNSPSTSSSARSLFSSALGANKWRISERATHFRFELAFRAGAPALALLPFTTSGSGFVSFL